MLTPPLSFPKDWPRIVKPHFLLGIPLLGAQASVYRELSGQLATRNSESLLEWGEDGARRELAAFAARVLGSACHWPNPFFVPDDPFILVAWDYATCGGVDHGLIDAALGSIASHVGLNGRLINWVGFQMSTFGEVIDFLLHQSTEQGTTAGA